MIQLNVVPHNDMFLQLDAKYPADYSELCLECNESIYLRMGGPKNMLNHIGKAQCPEFQQKKERSQTQSTIYINDFIFLKKRACSSYCSSTHSLPKCLPH